MLHGTGQVQRLAKLLPQLVSYLAGSETIALIEYRLAQWLALAFLTLHDDAKLALAYALQVGIERLGAALD